MSTTVRSMRRQVGRGPGVQGSGLRARLSPALPRPRPWGPHPLLCLQPNLKVESSFGSGAYSPQPAPGQGGDDATAWNTPSSVARQR